MYGQRSRLGVKIEPSGISLTLMGAKKIMVTIMFSRMATAVMFRRLARIVRNMAQHSAKWTSKPSQNNGADTYLAPQQLKRHSIELVEGFELREMIHGRGRT
jgi:hypothetical protein